MQRMVLLLFSLFCNQGGLPGRYGYATIAALVEAFFITCLSKTPDVYGCP